MGICTESGELLDGLKRALFYSNKAYDPVNALEEYGDLLWYIALGLDADGWTLDDALRRNLEKLATRYPEAFDVKRALSRDLDAERAALEGGSSASSDSAGAGS